MHYEISSNVWYSVNRWFLWKRDKILTFKSHRKLIKPVSIEMDFFNLNANNTHTHSPHLFIFVHDNDRRKKNVYQYEDAPAKSGWNEKKTKRKNEFSDYFNHNLVLMSHRPAKLHQTQEGKGQRWFRRTSFAWNFNENIYSQPLLVWDRKNNHFSFPRQQMLFPFSFPFPKNGLFAQSSKCDI